MKVTFLGFGLKAFFFSGSGNFTWLQVRTSGYPFARGTAPGNAGLARGMTASGTRAGASRERIAVKIRMDLD